MRKPQRQPQVNVTRTVQKYFVSAFVVCSFAAYAIHDRLGSGEAIASTVATNKTDTQLGRVNTASRPAATATNEPPSVVTTGLYKDGEYIGGVADAYFGQVQVKAIVQGGKVTDVQFLDFPHDRRTSQRINSYATPVLTSEAINAQNASVDIVSGATLTSEAFIASLQSALSEAKA